MSNYTKITDFTTKDTNQDVIEGVDFDNEFSDVATMSTTKADKIVPADADSVAGLDVNGNLSDTAVLISELVAALSTPYPTGGYLPYAGVTLPSGFLWCDGSSYLAAAYPDLFAALGYTWGGSGASFNVPDMRGRTPAGTDNMGGTSADRVTDAQADAAGGSMGAETHTLSTSETPAHDHGGSTSTDGAHTHSGYVGTSNTGASGDNKSVKNVYTTTTSNGDHSHTISSEGGGAAHNNMQPTLFSTWIIKT